MQKYEVDMFNASIVADTLQIEKALLELKPASLNRLQEYGIGNFLCLPDIFSFTHGETTRCADGSYVVSVKVKFRRNLEDIISTL